jgi:hypothetical protein
MQTTPDELLRAEEDFSANAAPIDRTGLRSGDGTLQMRCAGDVFRRPCETAGSVSAAETEVANLFAIANQASIDSGSSVRWVMVGLQRLGPACIASPTCRSPLAGAGGQRTSAGAEFPRSEAMRDVCNRGLT